MEEASSSSSPSTSPTTPATNQSASRRSGYRVDVQLLSARTSIAEFRSSYVSRSNRDSTWTTSGSTTSTTFSGVGAITGRFLHSLGDRTIHGIEYLVKIRPVLKQHKDALLGTRRATLNKQERMEIVNDLLEISKADYLRMYRKQALEILILLGGKEIWLEMDSESRRCVRAGLLEICRNSRLSISDVEFAQGHLEKCISWDLQIADDEHWHDLSDIRHLANEIREHASFSRKEWAYEVLHDILRQSSLGQSYPVSQRTSICKELLDMSIQGRRLARMTWAVESLISFLHLYDWDGCLSRDDMELMCSSLFALAQKDDSKASKTRDWALYHMWEFARLPAWQHAEPAVFSPEKWSEIITTMLAYARNASSTQQKRAFETLLEFLELDAVGDPLKKAEKQQICKEMLAFSRQATSSKDKKWAFELTTELMCLKTWTRLTVKVHRVSNVNRPQSPSSLLPPSTSPPSLSILHSLAKIGRSRSPTEASNKSHSSFGTSSGEISGIVNSASMGSDVINISSTAVGEDTEYAIGQPNEDDSLVAATVESPPIRIYASDWEESVSAGEDIDIEAADPYETGGIIPIPRRRQASTPFISPSPPRVSLHLPKVVLHTPFTESPASFQETQPLPLLSPTSSTSSFSPQRAMFKRPFSESPASLRVTQPLPPPSPVSPISSASSSSPPRVILTTPLFESPASLRIPQALPPTSPVAPPSPRSPRIPSPASSSSSHSQLYRDPPPRSPAPTGPLPQVPFQPTHRLCTSIDSAFPFPPSRPPPCSPLPPPPDRTVSDPQLAPSATIRAALVVANPVRPATSPQAATRSNARRQNLNERGLPPVREEGRSRPRGDSFLDIG